MSPEEMKLDMLVAELDYENRLLRARNERLEREAEQRKPWLGLTDLEREKLRSEADEADAGYTQLIKATEAKLREKNQ